jgi:hypothetical protein
MSIMDTHSTASEHLVPLAPQLVNDTAKAAARGEPSAMDAAHIILRLEQNHAKANAVGCGGPELGAFYRLLVSLVSEADNPQAVIAHVAELLSDHVENTACLAKLVHECERLGLALQLTEDPAVDLPEIRVFEGRRTVVARTDEVAVAYDDVHAIGRCRACSGELDDTALIDFPANALLSFRSVQDMTGAEVKICRACVEASGLPLTAAQRGGEWMLRWGCLPWCVNDHAEPFAAEWHTTLPAETKLRDAAIDSCGRSGNGDGLPWLSARVVVSNDKPQAYGRNTQVWLDYGLRTGELSPAEARSAMEAMRCFVKRLEHVVTQAEEIAQDDFEGDPEIALLDREASDRRVQFLRNPSEPAAHRKTAPTVSDSS